MMRFTRKLIAVILAIWLPLLSGNTLAMSLAMQAARGVCHSAAAQQEVSHCDPAMQQAHPAVADPHEPVGHQNVSGDECGTCHLACCGYLAPAPIKVTDARLPGLPFARASAQFQSITSAPLDPPPLTRA